MLLHKTQIQLINLKVINNMSENVDHISEFRVIGGERKHL